ncbi:urease accessory protein UreD [Microbulbifer sp. Q7]|uniref:urease accessory protein UreD n=1 Tax=Microbulbifer sp. Q7 TaxID=1785091 RepID=UPI00082FD246|nr:urease accessory protein UreD [Microbulbifer sp. Q7]
MNQLAVPDPRMTDNVGAQRWHADLELQFARGPRGCRLARNRHSGPLYVQKPFYPEGPDLAHVYLLHPPGGLVSGDRLDIRVQVQQDAAALVTTTGAGRVYRARHDGLLQCQSTALQVEAGASLEWLPLENIAYPGANGAMHTRVDLAQGARFAGWEVTSLGLPACNAPFADGTLIQRLEIFREGTPLLVESLRLCGEEILQARAGLQGQAVNGLLVMGPFDAALEESGLEECRDMIAAHNHTGVAGITLVGELLVVRALGRCAFEVRGLFTELWKRLRPEWLGRPPCAPRIWRT